MRAGVGKQRRTGSSILLFLFATFIGIVALTTPATAATPVTCSAPKFAAAASTEYLVSLADASQHVAHVSIRLQGAAGQRTLDMPVWNALYQVRDFAANIEQVRAIDANGLGLAVSKTSPSEWTFAAPAGCVVVSYDIYLNSGGPFGSQMDASRGFFNWAMVLMYSPALRNAPITLHLLDVPPTWAMRDLHVLGGAEPGKVEQANGYAHNYDELADSPVSLGMLQQTSFEEDGATYHIVVDGLPADYDLSKIAEVLRKLTHAEVDWMQDRPFDEYTFLYHFPRGSGGGGMEHAYGTAIEVSASRLRESPSAVDDVTAHEFFHLWNVKRIRPQALEPIDYQHTMDTRDLWFCEGLTSTVGDMMRMRAGLVSERHYLAGIGGQITELQLRPAHRWQSVEESGLNAWFEGIGAYRSPDRSISYYNKGFLVGVMLDLRMREVTGGQKSLRDLFQFMNEHYPKQHRYFDGAAAVQQAAESITGQSFSAFFADYVAGTKEIPYDEFFRFVGIEVVQGTVQTGAAGFATTANLGGQPEVSSVDAGSEAERAGIKIGDLVVELNGAPADASLDDRLERMAPGTAVKLRVTRRRGEQEIKLRLGAHSQTVYELHDVPGITPQQLAHRDAWMHGDDEGGGRP